MLSIQLAGDAARWLLVVAFALAGLEKALTIKVRSEAWHPVMMLAPWRRRHARTLMVVSLLLDVAVVAGLLVLPAAGSALALAAIALYTAMVARMHASGSGGGCRCFWRVMNVTTTAGLAIRNGILAAAAVLAAAAAPAAPGVAGIVAAALTLWLLALLIKWLEGGRVPSARIDAAPEPGIVIVHSGGGSRP